MIEFLGEYSLERGINRLKQVASGKTLVVVPDTKTKERLTSAVDLPNIKILREFEAALSFFEGEYPIALVRELLCLRVIRTELGDTAARLLFPLREPGVSEARTLHKLFDELFLLGRTAASISEELARLIHPEAERWKSLAALETLYTKELAKEGFKFELSDRGSKVILFGVLKLAPLLKKVIASSEVTPFVFDSTAQASSFNQYGELIGDGALFTLPELEFVSTPREYFSGKEHNLQESSSGIILFDETETKVAIQALKERGYEIEALERGATNSVITLVRAVLEAYSSERLFDLFSLLRIISVQDFVHKELTSSKEQSLLKVVDEYQTDRLQLKWTKDSLPEGKGVLVVREILSILKRTFITPLKSVESLSQASQVISSWSKTFYPESTELVIELDKLGDLSLRDSLSVEDSFRLVLDFITARVPVKVKPGKLRIFTSLDSAYIEESCDLVLFGPVLGRIPKSKSKSIFLNPGILKILGLEQDDFRVQRYILGQLSRRIKSIVIPRYSLSGDPTSISPLFYPKDPRAIAAEVLRFYDGSEIKAPLQNQRTQVVQPLPMRDLSVLRNKEGKIRISITALDFYAAAPFQFYIERVLQARHLTDERRELEASQFGDLAHLVLRSVLTLQKNQTAEEIKLIFERELSKLALEIYGDNLSAAVETQFYNLNERLLAYAKYEFKSLAEGWRTIYSEQSSKPYTLQIPKEPIELTARVDRIDYHEQLKTYRIWDYKTGDNIKSIFKRDSSISSLQLPLYAFFLSQGLFGDFHPGSKIEVGYIALGSMVSEPKSYPITESNLEEALLLAKEAGTGLVNCRFELGDLEKLHSSSDFSMFLNYQAIEFGEDDESRE